MTEIWPILALGFSVVAASLTLSYRMGGMIQQMKIQGETLRIQGETLQALNETMIQQGQSNGKLVTGLEALCGRTTRLEDLFDNKFRDLHNKDK